MPRNRMAVEFAGAGAAVSVNAALGITGDVVADSAGVPAAPALPAPNDVATARLVQPPGGPEFRTARIWYEPVLRYAWSVVTRATQLPLASATIAVSFALRPAPPMSLCANTLPSGRNSVR